MNKLISVALVAGALAIFYMVRFPGDQTRNLTTAVQGAKSTDEPISLLADPQDLPEIQFVDDNNRPLSLSDFKGKVVLLNIWATWCPPCREEMPGLDRLQARLGGGDFQVIPLSTDLNGLVSVERFYEDAGISFLGKFLDQSGNVSVALKVPGLPATYLIDRDGKAVGIKLGPAEWDSEEVVSLIEKYL